MKISQYINYTIFALLVFLSGCNNGAEKAETEDEHHEDEENVVEVT